VRHLIAEHLLDLSDLLRSLIDRDDGLIMRHRRGDEAKIGTRDRLREGLKETVDGTGGDVAKRADMPTIRISASEFH
jgi:error-prone DNA polymerase